MRFIKPKIELVYKIWGGQRLSALKKVAPQNDLAENLGEVWEISSLQEAKTVTLDEPLSYLFKLIDTSDYLSVQVHPQDEYALEHTGGKGKSECWVILESLPGACLFLGFKPGVTREKFRAAVTAGEDLSSLLVKYTVNPGDVFVVPAGAVHAIGPGILLAEVQQSSGVTYRVWDWNRVDSKGKPRELHIKEAFDVLNFDSNFQKMLIQYHFKNLFSLSKTQIYQHPDFTFWYQKVTSTEKLKLVKDRPLTVFAVEGDVKLTNKTESITLSKGESLLILPEEGDDLQLSPLHAEVKCLFIN